MKTYHCKSRGCKYKVRTSSFRKAMSKIRKHKDKKHPNWRKRRRSPSTPQVHRNRSKRNIRKIVLDILKEEEII